MAALSDFTGTLGNVWQLGLNGARLRSNSGAIEARSANNDSLAPFLASQVRASFVSAAGVRQTVLQGSVDSTGLIANALSAGSGLSVTLTASFPFVISFAYGFDIYGQVDYVAAVTTNQSFSGLTASTTNYLYVDRDIATGTLSYGFSTLTPIYSNTTPSAPATGQHWFDTSRAPNGMQMKRYNGSVWVSFQRVFIGEAITSSTAVTSVDTYTYGGLFQTGWFAVTTSTSYTKKHYLGMTLAAAQAAFTLHSSTSSTGATNSTIGTSYTTDGNLFYGYILRSSLIDNRLGIGFATAASGVHFDSGGAWSTSGYYNLTFKRGW